MNGLSCMTTADDYDNNHILTHIDTNTYVLVALDSLYVLEGGIDLVVRAKSKQTSGGGTFINNTCILYRED